ncbi:MAG TPA: ABC transporter substrate-binding protein [Chitinophagaceae bacterium]|jgi:putative ABC transport system substrate-binding protein
MMKKYIGLALAIVLLTNCNQKKAGVPVVGFVDAFEDNTIEQAKTGFTDALKKNGFDEKEGNIKILYRNAQGSIPTLTQIVKYFIAEKVDLLATNASLSTITALQNTKTIPVFMMVSPTPALMKLVDSSGTGPANLFGVGEELSYIDTSFLLIPRLVKPRGAKLKVGMIFNQSEPQSVEAMDRISQLAAANNIELVSLPINTSADVQLITASLLSNGIDAFFANPDNTVFASFETIVRACNKAAVPVFTSEAGLVARGAVAAYGADIYQWGYQAGEQAAQYLKASDKTGFKWEMVKLRRKVYNEAAATTFHISIPPGFEAIK